MVWRSVVLLGCLCAWAEGGGETRLVETAEGEVRGYKDPEFPLYSFHGIPYATAPKGPNKFKAPLPAPLRQETLDAKDNHVICPQPNFPMPLFSDIPFIQQEDCLIANVYTPDTEENNLPVVVYVHGGGFQLGWGTMLVHKKLIIEHNIIIVSFNYRLGIHGFLCLGTEDAPGNAGMKDQVALLRWVNKNIAKFGGNPDDVTIAGYSAGSASVDLLMLSKSAEGLFNKVIPESAVASAVFSIQSDPLENAKWFARVNNFTDVDDIYALQQFYKTAPLETLTKDPFFERTDSTFVFSPCLERPSEEAFLLESPIAILTKGTYKKVPVLHGFADMEGLFRVPFFELWKNRMNEKFSDFLPADLKFETEEEKEKVAQTVKHFYFGDKPVSNENIFSYIDYFSDVFFTFTTLNEIKLMVENGHDQIYLYEYSFVDNNTEFVPGTFVKGAPHCAQSSGVAGQVFSFDSLITNTDDFDKLSFKMRKLWANFIKTGRPVPEDSRELPAWPAVRADGSPHMSLGRELRLRGPLLPQRARLWEGVYARHYRQPIPPPAPPTPTKEDL